VAFHQYIFDVDIRWHHAFTDFHDFRAPARKLAALP
jgi:hypothetical protein